MNEESIKNYIKLLEKQNKEQEAKIKELTEKIESKENFDRLMRKEEEKQYRQESDIVFEYVAIIEEIQRARHKDLVQGLTPNELNSINGIKNNPKVASKFCIDFIKKIKEENDYLKQTKKGKK